MLTEL